MDKIWFRDAGVPKLVTGLKPGPPPMDLYTYHGSYWCCQHLKIRPAPPTSIWEGILSIHLFIFAFPQCSSKWSTLLGSEDLFCLPLTLRGEYCLANIILESPCDCKIYMHGSYMAPRSLSLTIYEMGFMQLHISWGVVGLKKRIPRTVFGI